MEKKNRALSGNQRGAKKRKRRRNALQPTIGYTARASLKLTEEEMQHILALRNARSEAKVRLLRNREPSNASDSDVYDDSDDDVEEDDLRDDDDDETMGVVLGGDIYFSESESEYDEHEHYVQALQADGNRDEDRDADTLDKHTRAELAIKNRNLRNTANGGSGEVWERTVTRSNRAVNKRIR